MNRLFHSAPIGVADWVHIVAVGLVIYLVVGAEKRFRHNREASGTKT